MLGLLLTGLTAVAQATAIVNSHFPVYTLNSEGKSKPGSLIDNSVASNLVSYFLGECYDSAVEGSEVIASLVSSPFLADQNSLLVVVDNFDTSISESKLGSPDFYLDSKSGLGDGLADVPLNKIASKTHKYTGNKFKVNAIKDGVDYNHQIIELLSQEFKDTRLMIVGVPADEIDRQLYRKQVQEADNAHVARLLAAEKNKTAPYIKIPDFFDSEETCASLTNDCSGHGSCQKTSNGKYACRCVPNTDKGYTYYWGGNDCSKRDVSFQFNLIVGTTLAVVVASVLSVTLLYKLGSEPLPGILNMSSL